MSKDEASPLAYKSQKPLIFVTAAITIAVIIMAIQLVFLTFTVSEQKDNQRNMSSATDLVSVQNKVTAMNNALIDFSRDIEVLRADYNRIAAEVNAMQNIMGKTGDDYQFLQQELTNFDNRINNLERHASNSEYLIHDLERTIQRRSSNQQ